MVGGVTCQMLPHLTGVPHLHVNRPLALQNSVVVVQNNGKERQKAAARENLVFLLIIEKECAARAICFFANWIY